MLIVKFQTSFFRGAFELELYIEIIESTFVFTFYMFKIDTKMVNILILRCRYVCIPIGI
jgi:hypothetical protein